MDEFEDLKKTLTSYHILRYFNPTLETCLKTDSSQHTVGSVLAQCVEGIEHVVADASQSFTPQILHKECYAIVWAAKKFTKYLDGCHFGVYTEHHSLCSLFKIRDPHGKLAHWAITLQEYDFHIVFKTCPCNWDADCLSHLPTLKSDLVMAFVEVDRLLEEQEQDVRDGNIHISPSLAWSEEDRLLRYANDHTQANLCASGFT